MADKERKNSWPMPAAVPSTTARSACRSSGDAAGASPAPVGTACGCRINGRPLFGSCVTSTSGPGSRGRKPSRCEEGRPAARFGRAVPALHRRVFSPLIGKKNSRGHNSETFPGNECLLKGGAFSARPVNARRSDIHEEPPVKTGARRVRDFPDIHSASPAAAERHERVCGCSHSHRRRHNAPCRTSGCNLSPALDLDVEPVEPLLS